MTYRPSAFCLDCGEEEFLFIADCCDKPRPGCALRFLNDPDKTIECRSGNGCRREVTV